MNLGLYIQLSPACQHHLLTGTSAPCRVPLKYVRGPRRCPTFAHNLLVNKSVTLLGPPGFLLHITGPAAAPSVRLWDSRVFMVSCAIAGLGIAAPSPAGVTSVPWDSSNSALNPSSFLPCRALPRLLFPFQVNPCKWRLGGSSADLTPSQFRPKSFPWKHSSEIRTKSTKCQSLSHLLST